MSISAAGGVVWRALDARVAVAVIHRPHRRDWSLPKGKLDQGEDERAAAIREVAEEIGAQVDVEEDLGTIDYVVGREGRREPKSVRYWSMRYRTGDFAPNDEVDELRWLPVGEAAHLLTYDRDREVLARFVAARDAEGERRAEEGT